MGSEDFSRYMNKPECPVEVSKIYTRTDLLIPDKGYKVLEVHEREGKFYALCSHVDPFDDSVVEEEVYAYYLEEEVD